MVHPATLLPDWNSLESVRAAHNVFELSALVFFAALVVMDALAHLTEDRNPVGARSLEKIGLVCFAVAVLSELVAYPLSRRDDFLSDERDRQRGIQIRTLDEKAKRALGDSNTALDRAKTAKNDSAVAKIDAAQAKTDARTAVDTARTARTEADSYEAQIESAVKQSTGALGQLSEARQRAADADARALEAKRALDEYKAPRVISPEQQQRIMEKLKRFAGQKFALSVYPNPEAIGFATPIDDLLRASGWERIPPQIMSINVMVRGVEAGQSFDAGVEAFIGPDNASAMPALRAIGDALTSEGIPCGIHRTEQLAKKTPQAITLAVGAKP